VNPPHLYVLDDYVESKINLRYHGDGVVTRSSVCAVTEGHPIATLRVEAMLEAIGRISRPSRHRLTGNEWCDHAVLVVLRVFETV
jgi:hypothetical protein